MIREAEKDRAIHYLSTQLMAAEAAELERRRDEAERSSEIEEMLAMRGAGPWRMPGALGAKRGEYPTQLRESLLPFTAQGAYGDTEIMLNNIEWKRETALSWLEFTRWGIQQIILIARLRCTKDPMLQRGMKVSAQYVFGRGVEITSPDEAAAEILKDWRERNKSVLGQVALSELEQSKYHDGNLFFVCFTDRANTGEVIVRTIDAVEILDIISDPDDSGVPWFYRREWVQQMVDEKGNRRNESRRAWYPALNYEPTDRPSMFADGVPIMWDAPVYHRKCGSIGKWHFGLPIVYAALGYAKAVQRFLEDCMTIRNSLAQFSMILRTKGGQQAMQGAKTQLSTTVGPNASLWDSNPTATPGAIFTSGFGTELSAFSSKGAGGDPAEVREYKLQVAMVFGLPESFFSDMNTSNLATATSLDRPTELNFMEKQEIWREDLITLALYQLRVSARAPSGKLREALREREEDAEEYEELDLAEAVGDDGEFDNLDLREGWVTMDGAHVFIGDGGVITKGPAHLMGKTPKSGATAKMSKADIAKHTYSGGLKEHQILGDKTASEIGEAIGVPLTSNNKAFDLESKKYGIEVKTLITQNNDKVTMNSYARQLKQERQDSAGLKSFTVVVDKRPAGLGSSTGTTRYFVKSGFGSFRVGSMTEVKSAAAIKTAMRKMK